MKKLLFIFVLFLFSCKKEVVVVEDFIQPVMIKVQAVHTDGLLLDSPTVLVR